MRELSDESGFGPQMLMAWFRRHWFAAAVAVACCAGLVSCFFREMDFAFEESPISVWWRYASSPVGLFFHALFLLPVTLSVMRLVIFGPGQVCRAFAGSRRAWGVWFFAAALFAFEHMPGLVTTTHSVSDDQVTATYHRAVLPLVLLAVAGAALAVFPGRQQKGGSESAEVSFVASILTWLLVLYPIQVVFWFYSYVLRQRILLGAWPQPYRPDPKTAGMNFHHDTIYIAFAAVPVIALAGLACIVALRAHKAGFSWRWAQACWVLALVILIALLFMDPGRFIEWYCD
jgi:hypothetical protein